MSFEFPPEDVRALVNEIAEILIRRKETVAISEAACGGLLSSFLVSLPGASQWFHGSMLVYSLKSRLKLGGWSQEDIQSYTGPSHEVALRLARNLRVELGATYTLSETGFASESQNLIPNYGDQAVGTVYFGISTPMDDKVSTFHSGSTDRCTNMRVFATKGLEFLLGVLREKDATKNNIPVDTA